MKPTGIVLTEVDDGPASEAAMKGSVQQIPDLVPGGSGPALWTGLVHTPWQWLQPITWIVIGPTLKFFHYTAEFTLEDVAHKVSYTGQTSEGPAIVVIVSSTKQGQADAAFGLNLAGIVLIAMGIGILTGGVVISGPLAVLEAWKWIAAGATLIAAATALGLRALDPVQPDFHYREPIRVLVPALPEVLVDLPQELVPLGSALELINRMLAAYDALGQIQGRLLGARIDGDVEGLRLQASAYREAERLLRMAAAHLPGAVAETAQLIAENESFELTKIRDVLSTLQREGLPETVRQEWAKSRLPDDALTSFETILSHGLFPNQPFGTLLVKASQALVNVAREVEAKTPAILAGVEK
jgi:hypothetical protein